MENLVTVGSAAAISAVPACSVGSATPETFGSLKGLRAELSAAIDARRLADERARAAAGIAARADSARRDAEAEAARIQAALDAARADATREHAQRLTAAFKTGETLPADPTLPETDTGAMAAAAARLDAIRQSAGQLGDEASTARAEAARAAESCRALVDSIIASEARDIARQWIAAIRLGWELQDRLTGLLGLGGDLLPRDFQEDILNRIDRRKAAIAADPQMLERHNFDAFLDRTAAAEEKRWLDYGRRLMNDAAATFDAAELPQ